MTQPRYNRIRQCGVTHRAAETRACQLGHCFFAPYWLVFRPQFP
jgi:hypothetical protein